MRRKKNDEGKCPICGKYGNIIWRPVTGGMACTFRCWTDADFDAPEPNQPIDETLEETK